MPLFVMGCTIANPPGYVTTGLQPNNCGTPYQFKPCGGGGHVSAAQPVWPSKSLVVIEELTGPSRELPAPGPHDLINYSRFSLPDRAAPLTPALGAAPELDK
jgi:hypothetical protein